MADNVISYKKNQKKRSEHQNRWFYNVFQNESALGHKLWQAADSFWNRYFENYGRICFFNTSYFC